MTLTAEIPAVTRDAVTIAEGLSERIAAGAEQADAEDRFVMENYALLKEAGLVEAGVPRALGGGGADVRELAAMLRVLGRACGSTALAFAMHTHQVAIPAWRWQHQKVAAVEPLLRRVAAERIVLLSSGGSDWINGSGVARRVEGGFRVSGRKIFTSGAAAGGHLHDRRGAGGGGPASCPAFRSAHESGRSADPGYLAHAGNAGHRVA